MAADLKAAVPGSVVLMVGTHASALPGDTPIRSSWSVPVTAPGAYVTFVLPTLVIVEPASSAKGASAGPSAIVEAFWLHDEAAIVGVGVGSGYDINARALARHLSARIPGNPTVVPQHMDGAGSLRLANWLFRVGAKDGSVIGTFSVSSVIGTCVALAHAAGPPAM